MGEAFLIQVGSALEMIKKKGSFKTYRYRVSNKVYLEQCGVVKQVKAQLAQLDGSTGGEAGTSKKSIKKSTVTAAEESTADLTMQADYMSEIKQAQEATEKAKAKGEQAAVDIMFQLYTNLLSVNAMYAWNKIIHKQMASDPYTDLQKAVQTKNPGDFCKSHLMTA
jgi:hypothetical protein